jgi:hypothetical protein
MKVRNGRHGRGIKIFIGVCIKFEDTMKKMRWKKQNGNLV